MRQIILGRVSPSLEPNRRSVLPRGASRPNPRAGLRTRALQFQCNICMRSIIVKFPNTKWTTGVTSTLRLGDFQPLLVNAD